MAEKTREELIEQLHQSQKFLSALLELTVDVQDWQPEPAEWSFRLIAAHLVTVERDCYVPRVKRIVSGEGPHFGRYASTGIDLDCGDVNDSLRRWAEERTGLLEFVARLPDDALHLTGTHETYGVITAADALNELAEHDSRQFRHVRQLIEDYIDEVNEAESEEVSHV